LYPSQRSPLAFETAVVVESKGIFRQRSLVALTKFQGRMFVNEIWTLAPDAPNVTDNRDVLGWQGNMSVIEAETFTNIYEGVSGSMRFGQFLKA
jgi:hypothetical protein